MRRSVCESETLHHVSQEEGRIHISTNTQEETTKMIKLRLERPPEYRDDNHTNILLRVLAAPGRACQTLSDVTTQAILCCYCRKENHKVGEYKCNKLSYRDYKSREAKGS